MRLSTFPLISSDLHRASLLRVIMASLFCCQDCGELLLEMSCHQRTARGCLTTPLDNTYDLNVGVGRYLGGESAQISAVIIDIQRSGLLTDILLQVPLQFFIFRYLCLHLVTVLLHDVSHPSDLLILVSQINLNIVLHQINPLPEFSGFQIVNNDIFGLFEHLNGVIDFISAQHKFIIFIIEIVKLLNKLLLIEVSIFQATL